MMKPSFSKVGQVTTGSYVFGFISSLILTLTAYWLVTHHVFGRLLVTGIICALAFLQFLIQMVFFLHLGSERRPRWKFLVFCLMIFIVLILVVGTLWIMANLNYHMPSDIKTYLQTNEGL